MSNDINTPVYRMITKIRLHIRESVYQEDFDYASSIKTLTHYLDVAKDMEHDLLVGQINETLGTIELERSNFPAAQSYYADSLAFFEKIKDTRRIGIMLSNLGEVHRRWKKPDQAALYYQRARQVAQDVDDMESEFFTYGNEGLLWINEDQLERGQALLEQAFGIVRGLTQSVTVRGMLSEAHYGLAQAYLKRADYEQAWRHALESLSMSIAVNRMQKIASAYQIMAQVAAADPDSEHNAADLFRQSREHWERVEAKVELAEMLLIEGDYWVSQKEVEKAKSCYRRAKTLFVEMELNDRAQVAEKRQQQLL